jgi:hypothetical protein
VYSYPAGNLKAFQESLVSALMIISIQGPTEKMLITSALDSAGIAKAVLCLEDVTTMNASAKLIYGKSCE